MGPNRTAAVQKSTETQNQINSKEFVTSNIIGATYCTQCRKGFFADTSGSWVCRACPEGSYQGSKGARACVGCGPGFTCPPGSVVPIPASCLSGTYLDTATDECLPCLPGSFCAGGGAQQMPAALVNNTHYQYYDPIGFCVQSTYRDR